MAVLTVEMERDFSEKTVEELRFLSSLELEVGFDFREVRFFGFRVLGFF